MKTSLRRRLAGAFAAVALMLGMGVAPASAVDAADGTAAPVAECAARAPAAVAVGGADQAPPPLQCNEIACDRSCKGRFGPFASGFCGEDGVCRCAL